ncbi:MAG: SDR family oxidoreductase [Synoicihabitans sp.]
MSETHSPARLMSENRTILVTGASGGIGSALCSQLSAAGHTVIAASRDLDRLADTEAAHKIQGDCTSEEGTRELFEKATEAVGDSPFGLAHCLGNTLLTPLHRTRASAWAETMKVNLDSSFHLLHAWINRRLQAKAGGSAVFVSSVVARIGVANHEAIAAAKGGLEALVRSAAATYAAQNLRCNVVAPGLTDTPLTAPMLKSEAFRSAATKQYPLAGLQEAHDVASAMAWLLSDQSSRITGQIIPVDGGFTAIRPLVK